jgi:threonine dehydrogenase-like Zn-dependent dehydrogenase
MRAITVVPGQKDSARLDDVPEPPEAAGPVLVEGLALGICGTDLEIVGGEYGWAPPGSRRLVLGHESLGRVLEAPPSSGFDRGDLVVGIVRRPDPVPCENCAIGEWDMCRNGRYTERGIKERHGYGAERFRIEPEFAVKIDPVLGILGVLLEPASILAKAWDHTDRIGHRARAWQPRVLLVTGAGPIGLLAALMGKQRGLDVYVLDRNKGGPKEAIVRDLGGTYHTEPGALEGLAPDILMECTGAPAVIRACLTATAAAGILCLTGVTEPGKVFDVDIGRFNRTTVLDNNVVFGTVNANRRHYEMAADALVRADKRWLSRLITRTTPVERWSEALEHRKGDIKVVIDFRS